MMRIAFSVAGVTLGMTWAVSGVAAIPPEEAKAKIALCIEKDGGQYIEARNWLISHAEALEMLSDVSWKESWLKRICRGWIENRDPYERAIKTFEIGEMNARRSVRVGVPDSFHWAKGASRTHGDKDVPLMVECLWKTGRNWRRYKAWRMYAVVEYLKRHGDASVLDPAIESLVSQSWSGAPAPDAGSEYPRMDRIMTAGAHGLDQLAPYAPVRLIVQFGDEDTLNKLRALAGRPQTSQESERALQRSIELLERRLDRKKRGEPTEEVDLAVEFGGRQTLESLRIGEDFGGLEARQKIRNRIEKLEKRLQQEKQSSEAK